LQNTAKFIQPTSNEPVIFRFRANLEG